MPPDHQYANQNNLSLASGLWVTDIVAPAAVPNDIVAPAAVPNDIGERSRRWLSSFFK